MFLFIFIISLPSLILGHCFLLSIQGSDGIRSTAFGSRLLSRGTLVQQTGIFSKTDVIDPKQATRRVGPCGRIYGGDSLPGFVIDVEAEMKLAEASGIPTASQNGTIDMGVYVANPDGAGPFTCTYSSDTSLDKFYPMEILHQVEGFKGINHFANNFVYPLSASFQRNSSCHGGQTKDVCVMKCTNPNGFGSCAAVKLPSNFGHSTSSSNLTAPNIISLPSTSGASPRVSFLFGYL